MYPNQVLTIRKRQTPQVVAPKPTGKNVFVSLPEHIKCGIIEHTVVEKHALGSIARQWMPPALAQVNRRFREEVIPIYYGRNKFVLSIQVQHQVEAPASSNFGFGALCGMFESIKDHLQWVSDITVEYQIETPYRVLCVGATLADGPPCHLDNRTGTHPVNFCTMGEAGTNWTNFRAVKRAVLEAAQLEYLKQAESRCIADTQIRRVAKVLHLMANYCIETTCGQGWLTWRSTVNYKPERFDFAESLGCMTDSRFSDVYHSHTIHNEVKTPDNYSSDTLNGTWSGCSSDTLVGFHSDEPESEVDSDLAFDEASQPKQFDSSMPRLQSPRQSVAHDPMSTAVPDAAEVEMNRRYDMKRRILRLQSALEKLEHSSNSSSRFLPKTREGPGSIDSMSLSPSGPRRPPTQSRTSQIPQSTVPLIGEGDLAPQEAILEEHAVSTLAPQIRTPRDSLASPPLSEEDNTAPPTIGLPVKVSSKHSKPKDTMGVRGSKRKAKAAKSKRTLRRSARQEEHRKDQVGHTPRSSLH
ncbi:hypothetical protein GGR57DRAFT_500573 [Xylariaceae sp. FL1272]|nr:hypothetical protein GGR57DRAFT_500573 [Xylariaceae sp. FL1272]